MIKVNQLSKSFFIGAKELPILRIKEWSVDKGQRIALIGPSGSGKSTLLHLLGGVLKSDSGEVIVESQHLHRFTEAQRDAYRAKYVGYIFQDFHLIPSLTAKQNVELVMNISINKKERQRLLENWFERVGLKDRIYHLPSQMSRGQQQRVAIVRALINSPQLILADEPTGSLDWETASEIMNLLLELCEMEGRTLITVTHDLHLAELYPERIQMKEINQLSQPEVIEIEDFLPYPKGEQVV
jgi:putative ABC transport system ATP-binding protein